MLAVAVVLSLIIWFVLVVVVAVVAVARPTGQLAQGAPREALPMEVNRRPMSEDLDLQTACYSKIVVIAVERFVAVAVAVVAVKTGRHCLVFSVVADY